MPDQIIGLVGLGRMGGPTAGRLLGIIKASSGRSSAFEDRLPRSALSGTFNSGFTTGLSCKHVRLWIDEAEAIGVPPDAGERRRQAWSILRISRRLPMKNRPGRKCAASWRAN